MALYYDDDFKNSVRDLEQLFRSIVVEQTNVTLPSPKQFDKWLKTGDEHIGGFLKASLKITERNDRFSLYTARCRKTLEKWEAIVHKGQAMHYSGGEDEKNTGARPENYAGNRYPGR